MAFNLDNITDERPKSQKKETDINRILKKEITLFGGKFSNKRKENFYTELSVLLKAGISLKDALVIIGDNEKNKHQKRFFDSLINDIISSIILIVRVVSRVITVNICTLSLIFFISF